MTKGALAHRHRGFTLVELLIFIVVVGAGLAGILSVMDTSVKSSADPMVRKQAIAIALSEARKEGAKVPKAPAKKGAAKKGVAKKAASKKTASKKAAPKKAAAKKTASKKTAAKKSTTKKAGTRKR